MIGLLTLRLGGHFLPLSTIAWGLSIALLFGNVEALGRHTGLSNIPALQLGPWSLADPRAIYYLIWVLVGAGAPVRHNVLQSRPGRAIRSLRGGGILLASVGADAFRVRLTLFVLAALLAGLAGWLYAHMNRFVSPSPFDVRASIEYLLMAVAGGLGHLAGALVGAARRAGDEERAAGRAAAASARAAASSRRWRSRCCSSCCCTTRAAA